MYYIWYLILFSLNVIWARKYTENYEVKNGVFGCLRVAGKLDILKDSITYVTKVWDALPTYFKI